MRYLGEWLSDAVKSLFSPASLRDRAPLILAALAVGSIGSLAVAVARSPEVMTKVDPLRHSFHQMMVEHSARSGLLLEQISVSGRHYTRAEDVLGAVNIVQGQPLLSMDPDEARARLESLPWIKHATVVRLFPNEVQVTLIERTPIALWQSPRGSYHLVDPDGVVIEGGYERFSHLPVVVGPGAPEAASDLLAMLNSQPDLSPRIKAAVRFGQRRWDLWIDGYQPEGVQVRLPEHDPDGALSRLAQMERDERILERDVSVIDLRIDDRLIVRKITDDDETSSQEKTPPTKTKAPAKEASKIPLSQPAAQNSPPKSGIPLRGPAQDA